MAILNQASILIVEDELLIAKNTAKKLGKLGYDTIKIVSSGQAALDFVRDCQPNLVLMDIAIKGDMDGIETASRIREMLDVPIIFMTAYANDEIIERASATGCYGYLIKPYREKELQATIKIALSKHSEQSEVHQALQSSLENNSALHDDIYRDNLTGLPSKLFLRDLYDNLLPLIADSAEEQSYSSVGLEGDDLAPGAKLKLIGVFNICLDRLNKIQNFLTREEQDYLIREIAERINSCVESFVGRGSTVYLKPDNFVILLAVDERLTANKYGQSLLNTLTQNFVIGDREIYLSPTIGIAFCPSDSKDISELLDQGYKAIEYARKNGGNRCQTFTFAFNIKRNKASDALRLESDLHRALERKELEVFYQPKLDLKTNRIVGSEALVRWNHPKMGRISPEKFIPLAEDIGLIKPIGEWVLTTACRQMQTWLDAGLENYRISVNLSGSQFRQSELFHQITQILFETSLEPQFLELELTETILLENVKHNVHKLNLLKNLGIKISLDDFGTGYSSLGYLQQFPFDALKIDACFVRNIEKDRINSVITKAVIDMAHQLNLQVVAEGVETQGELDFLKSINCDMMQGFWFSRPLSSWEFYKLAWENMDSANKIAVF
ncbi:MAG: EAL domain-containing protein [Cyanobacteria bacterium J06623_7]